MQCSAAKGLAQLLGWVPLERWRLLATASRGLIFYHLVSLVVCFSQAARAFQDESQTDTPAEAVSGDLSNEAPAELAALQQQLLAAGPLEASAELLRKWADARSSTPAPIEQQSEASQDEESSLEYLLHATYLNFREDGVLELIDWQIMRPKTREEATYVSQVVADWNPWRMDQPNLTARVLTPDDREIRNDGQSAFEQSASDGVTMLTDSRRLTLLLDSVEPEALVESRSVSLYRPLFDKSIAQRIILTDVSPARTHRLYVSSQTATPLHYTVLGPDLQDIEPEEGSPYQRIFATEAPAPLLSNYELGCGPDHASYPMVLVCSPGDWQAIGDAYAGMVDAAIEQGSSVVQSLVKSSSTTNATATPLEKVEWSLQRVRQLLRYTGVEFGEQRVFPVSPDVAIQRRFGDCKDQSTLLVAMLRELGIEAHVALLSASNVVDVPLEGKVADFFNHAIVYVDDLDVWIDPTADPFPVGMLSEVSYGRRALICDQSQSRMVTTPLGDSSYDTTEETYLYRINFSGGGDVCVSQVATGVEGLSVKTAFRDQRQQMKEGWSQFFESLVGEHSQFDLRHGTFSSTGSAVFGRSPAVQLFDRDNFRIDVPWDFREVLTFLPDAISAYTDSNDGSWNPPPQRRHPLFLNTGMTFTRECQFRFPGGLELTDVPAGWSRKVGSVSFEFMVSEDAAVEGSDVAEGGVAVAPDMRWQSIVSTLPKVDEAWDKAHDRLLRMRLKVTVEPAEMSVEEANLLIETIANLLDEPGKCSGNLVLTWKLAESLQHGMTEESIVELVRQAHRYKALKDPLFLLAAILQRTGFRDQVTALIPKLEAYDDATSISSNLYLQLLMEVHVIGHAPWSRFNEAADFYRERALQITLDDQWSWLTSLLVDEYGVLSEDPEVHREVIKEGKKLLQALGNVRSPLAVAIADRILASALKINDEREYENAERYIVAAAAPVRRTLRSLNTGRKESFAEYSASSRRMVLSLVWEILLTAERYDQANKLLEMYGDAAGINLKSIPLDQVRLAGLDENDPTSVVRHYLVAFLNYDLDQLRLLSSSEAPALRNIQEFNYLDVHNSWFVSEHTSRGRSLHEAVVANMNATVNSVSPLYAIVAMKGPYDWLGDLATSTLVKEYVLVRLDEASPWRVERGSSFKRWREMFAAGKQDFVVQELQMRIPAAPGIFGLFSSQSMRPHEELWHQIKPDVSYRTELVARVWEATDTGELAPLDEWLAAQELDLSNAQKDSLDAARFVCWHKQKDYAPVVASLLENFSPKSSLQELKGVLRVLAMDKDHGGSLWKHERNSQVIDELMSRGELGIYERAQCLFLRDETQAGLELLRSALNEPGELRGAEVDRLANSYLWQQLKSTKDRDELAKAYDLVQSKLSESARSDSNLLHTLACAAAQIGKTMEAFEYLIKHGSEDAHDVLLRGLVLQHLGFDEVAQSQFQKVIDAAPGRGNEAIARLHLSDPSV